MSKNVPSNHEPPISPADWDAIVAAAFSPDAEPHIFSDRYQKQKQKQEELFMQKNPFVVEKPLLLLRFLQPLLLPFQLLLMLSIAFIRHPSNPRAAIKKRL